jgi:hypothetical protein
MFATRVSGSFKLREIVGKNKLPVKDVEFADPNVHFDPGDDSTHVFKKLKVIQVYNESYFLANTISQGECPVHPDRSGLRGLSTDRMNE